MRIRMMQTLCVCVCVCVRVCMCVRMKQTLREHAKACRLPHMCAVYNRSNGQCVGLARSVEIPSASLRTLLGSAR